MYQIFTDSGANLTPKLVSELDIHIIPLRCLIDGTVDSTAFTLPDGSFDGKTFYDRMRAGADVKTTMINVGNFCDAFGAALEAGDDVIYVSLSSGISGTYQAAVNAKQELEEEYPDRYIHIVDSHGCGFGSGLLAIRAAELSKLGTPVRQAGAMLDADVPHMCQYFTVDDLNFLKRSGRVSGATAMIGTVLNIKPILYGDAAGHIVSCGKVRGRKKAIDAIVEKYAQKQMDAEHRVVAISHGDCPEEAELLAEKIRAVANPEKLIIVPHEPFSGAHVGPGMLALFFYGSER